MEMGTLLYTECFCGDYAEGSQNSVRSKPRDSLCKPMLLSEIGRTLFCWCRMGTVRIDL